MSDTMVSREPRAAQLDVGVYDASIIAVEAKDAVETAYGIKDVIYITYDVNGVEVRRRYNKTFSPNGALYKLVDILKPGEVPMMFELADLVGTSCRVMIELNTTESGDVWENVVKVVKAKPKPVEASFDDDVGDPELTG